jgi:hypothetical protein
VLRESSAELCPSGNAFAARVGLATLGCPHGDLQQRGAAACSAAGAFFARSTAPPPNEAPRDPSSRMRVRRAGAADLRVRLAQAGGQHFPRLVRARTMGRARGTGGQRQQRQRASPAATSSAQHTDSSCTLLPCCALRSCAVGYWWNASPRDPRSAEIW